jgi:hypothetical protein
MRAYGVVPLGPVRTGDATAVTAAALTEASHIPGIQVPAMYWELGSYFKFEGWGRYTSTGTPGTIVFGIYISPPATAIAAGQAAIVSGALTVPASQTNRTFHLSGNLRVTAIGSGTGGSVSGAMTLDNVTAALIDMVPATAPFAGFGMDTTVANVVRLGLTPSVATGSWTMHYWEITSRN